MSNATLNPRSLVAGIIGGVISLFSASSPFSRKTFFRLREYLRELLFSDEHETNALLRRMLQHIMDRGAINDYAIDSNWNGSPKIIDVAIQPAKSMEFIFIPIRINQ